MSLESDRKKPYPSDPSPLPARTAPEAPSKPRESDVRRPDPSVRRIEAAPDAAKRDLKAEAREQARKQADLFRAGVKNDTAGRQNDRDIEKAARQVEKQAYRDALGRAKVEAAQAQRDTPAQGNRREEFLKRMGNLFRG